MPIHYAFGDATKRHPPGPIVFAHFCNDIGKWGAGLVLAISKRWPERAFLPAFRSSARWALDDVQFLDVEPALTASDGMR